MSNPALVKGGQEAAFGEAAAAPACRPTATNTPAIRACISLCFDNFFSTGNVQTLYQVQTRGSPVHVVM